MVTNDNASSEKTNKDVISKVANHGYFLQRYCSSVMKDAGWDIYEEYPVTLTYQVGSGSNTYESSGDILGRLRNKQADYEVVLHTQAKRRITRDWFFLPDISRELVSFIQLSRYEPSPDILTYHGNLRLDKWPNPPGLLVCNIGRELADHTQEKSPKKLPKEDALYEACKEVSVSIRSVLEEEIAEDEAAIQEFGQLGLPSYSAHIPVVVTGANLHLVDFRPGNYKIEKAPNAKSRTVHYLVYRFPLHRYLQVALDREFAIEANRVKHLNVFIVHYEWFERFLHDIATYFEQYHNGSFTPFPGR